MLVILNSTMKLHIAANVSTACHGSLAHRKWYALQSKLSLYGKVQRSIFFLNLKGQLRLLFPICQSSLDICKNRRKLLVPSALFTWVYPTARHQSWQHRCTGWLQHPLHLKQSHKEQSLYMFF